MGAMAGVGLGIAALGTCRADMQYERLRSFGRSELLGIAPAAQLVQGAGGVLYGTTSLGGTNHVGTVFRINPDGTDHRVLHMFSTNTADGYSPGNDGLWLGRDGALYGTCALGGDRNAGVVFTLNQDGSGYRVLTHFGQTPTDGRMPTGGVMEASDGVLYGTTRDGGSRGVGMVYSLDKDGRGLRVLWHFDPLVGDSAKPTARLSEGSDGLLYGTTEWVGGGNSGSVFRLRRDGTDQLVLHRFAQFNEGLTPSGPLVEGGDGTLYGMTAYGGQGSGTLFRLNRDGSDFRVLHVFPNTPMTGGLNPRGGLIIGPDGVLAGTTTSGGEGGQGTVFRLEPDGRDFRVLRSFDELRFPGEGAFPSAALCLGTDGRLYGTTAGGGTNRLDGRSAGTMFSLGADGSDFRLRHHFGSNIDADEGAGPIGRVLVSRDGALYGTCARGGTNWAGVVFKVNRDGTGAALLHHFGGGPDDGGFPQAGLVEGADGALYGTTAAGGSGGTVFCLRQDERSYRVLHFFEGARFGDGDTPYASLVMGRDGALFGTTKYGGSEPTLGTVFKLHFDGSGYEVLHRFTGGTNGFQPLAELVQTESGTLAGTTDRGTVFWLRPDGTEFRVLHWFGGENNSPRGLQGGLLIGSDGRLYGTSSFGGRFLAGTVYPLNQDGSDVRVLHDFEQSQKDGMNPIGTLVEGRDGRLYGTTDRGGQGWGVLFALEKDGSDYRVLHHFGTEAGDGFGPSGGLAKDADGVLYGLTSSGGEHGVGTLFALYPAERPGTLQFARVGTTLQLRFAGTPGARYQVFRSTDLVTWQAADLVTMPAAGVCGWNDPSSGDPSAYYRVAWLP